MNALEQIKKIENCLSSFEPGKLFVDPRFILKAFNVMREIAIQKEGKISNGLPVMDCISVPQNATEWIDQEFEERMKDGR